MFHVVTSNSAIFQAESFKQVKSISLSNFANKQKQRLGSFVIAGYYSVREKMTKSRKNIQLFVSKERKKIDTEFNNGYV